MGAMIVAIISIPATTPAKNPTTMRVELVEAVAGVNSPTQPFLVTSLSCVGHCLLNATGVPATVIDGASSDNSQSRSLFMSVLAVMLPSGEE